MTQNILVFSSAGCVGCRATTRWLDQRGIEFTTVRVDLLPEAGAKLRSEGHSTLPVVRVTADDGTETSWAGHRPSRLESTLGGSK